MKLNCKIIEDLLPLYLDEVCSDESRRMVQEHLADCEHCRALAENTRVDIVAVKGKPATEQVVKKGLRKIRRRWWLSVLAVIVLVPLVVLGWNQYHLQGVHYSNIDELRLGKAFMRCISEGDYEKAFEMVDVDGLKEEWLSSWFDESRLANIKEDARKIFLQYAQKLEENGGIGDYEYKGISIGAYEEDSTRVYRLLFKVQYEGKETLFEVMVSDDGIEYFSGNGSFVDDPLAQFAIWAEYLWQEYEGCYFDPIRKEYIYP